MHERTAYGILVGSLILAQSLSTASAYETEEIATDRGNVPLYLPSNPEPGASLPLVVSLHGYTGNGSSHENYFNLRSRIDERQFLLCVPNGLRNAQGDRFWNATDFCCDFNGQNPDDSGYLRELIETVIADHPVDLDSIHVVGHSNGGFMSYRMACDHSDLIASIGSLAGATFSNPGSCEPEDSVHVLQIHGTQDTVIDFDGSCFPFFACYPGALESILIWGDYNQCSNATVDGEDLDLVGNITGAETSRTLLKEGCRERGTCELWAINGGNHGPNFNGNFSRELIDWLLEHRRTSEEACIGDLNGDGIIKGEDLTLLLSAWGGGDPERDLDGNGSIDGGDLNILLAAWGECP